MERGREEEQWLLLLLSHAAAAAVARLCVYHISTATMYVLMPNMYNPLEMSGQFHDVMAKCNNCIYLARQLRAKMYKLHRIVMRLPNFDHYPQFVPYMQQLNEEIKEYYDKLEQLVRRLPNEVPQSDQLNNLRIVYGAEHDTDEDHGVDENLVQTIEQMIDSGNWNEGQYQIFFYLTEFLRANRKRASSLYRRPIQLSNYTVSANPHIAFVKAYQGMKKEIKNQKFGIFPRVLRDDGVSMAMEFKIGVSSSDKNDKQIVCYLKILLSECYGVLEYINVIAPHEEWYEEELCGEKKLVITHPSRFLVYQKMTRQANVHLQQIGANTKWTSQNLVTVINAFGKMREIFEARCKICKKVLRDFLPPLIFEMRHPKEGALHEACR